MDEIAKVTPENILLLLQFVVPGFLIVYFRSLFVTRRQAAFRDNLLFFITVSVIYGFITLPLAGLLGPGTGVSKWQLWFTLLLAVPIAFGVLAGLAVQHGWVRRVLSFFGLRMVSPYPTGWDWAFSIHKHASYVIVTLSDGVQIFGYFGSESLAASDPASKDIFIEELYDVTDGQWSTRPMKQGIWILGSDIRHIEFIVPRQESANVEPSPA